MSHTSIIPPHTKDTTKARRAALIAKHDRANRPILTPAPAPEPIRHRSCQWPLWGDTEPAPRPPRYCGKPSTTGCPYCETHQARSRLRTSVRLWIRHHP